MSGNIEIPGLSDLQTGHRRAWLDIELFNKHCPFVITVLSSFGRWLDAFTLKSPSTVEGIIASCRLTISEKNIKLMNSNNGIIPSNYQTIIKLYN